VQFEGKIAFIGAGNMAQAIIRGLVGSGQIPADRIIAADPRADARESCWEGYRVHTCESNLDAVADSTVVMIAVKPQIVDRVLDEVRHVLPERALVVSVVAGRSTASLESRLKPSTRVVRTMPNVCALVGHGSTALAAGAHATKDDLALVERIFDSVGMSVILDESLMDAVTGLSGSGPAYVFMAIEALADGGVKMGLARRVAHQLAAHTVMGAAKLVIESQEHPGSLKDMVCSPGGTAIAGVHELESRGLRTTLMGAVETAAKRARELGAG
jgi:pyrroline-5-carboxylate reductase